MRFGLYAHDPAEGVALSVADSLRAAQHFVLLRNGSVFKGDKVRAYGGLDAVFIMGQQHTFGDAVRASASSLMPAFVIDLPPIRQKGYWQFGEMGLNRFRQDPPSDRIKISGLITKSKSAADPEGPVLFLGQKPRDAQHQMDDSELRGYAARVARQIHEELPDLDIYFKHHPRRWEKGDRAPEGMIELEADLWRAPIPKVCRAIRPRAVVTFNSTGALEALLERVPVFCDPSAFYSAVCGTDVAGVVESESALPSRPALEALLSSISWGIWHEEEFSTPEFVQHVLDRVEHMTSLFRGPKEQRQAEHEAEMKRSLEIEAKNRRVGRGGLVNVRRVR
jgi:hypothetical protein